MSQNLHTFYEADILYFLPNHEDSQLLCFQKCCSFTKLPFRERRKNIPTAFITHKKVKVKCSRYRSSVAQRVCRDIALLFHDPSTRRGWVVSSTPQPCYNTRKDLVSIVQEAGWAPGLVWTGRKSRPHRDLIPDHPARSQSLYRLSYLAHNLHYTYLHIPTTHEWIWFLCNYLHKDKLCMNSCSTWFISQTKSSQLTIPKGQLIFKFSNIRYWYNVLFT